MIDVKRFHRTRCLQPEVWKNNDTVRPEFQDLYMIFLRNRIWLQLSRQADYKEGDETYLARLFETMVVNKLEDQCKGFWTVDYQEDENVSSEDETVSIYIMFEFEEDLLNFLKNDGLMFRLAA